MFAIAVGVLPDASQVCGGLDQSIPLNVVPRLLWRSRRKLVSVNGWPTTVRLSDMKPIELRLVRLERLVTRATPSYCSGASRSVWLN